MDPVINKAGVRLRPGMKVKDCECDHTRHGSLISFNGRRLLVGWGPGKPNSRINPDSFHTNSKKKSGFYVLKKYQENS
jgi:hypothetical protein